MEEEYKTILKSKEVVFVLKRSKFIGNIEYVKTKEDALLFISKIKTKYKDATHNVVAYNIKLGGLMYCSDDGEPHGTAGRPILDVLTKNEIFDVCVVVTRYFGGVLLGTGGLCYSYSSCCKKIIEEATLCRSCLCVFLELTFQYKNLKKIESIFLAYNVKKVKEIYLQDVCFIVALKAVDCDSFKEVVLEKTNGEVKFIFLKKDWERIKL